MYLCVACMAHYHTLGYFIKQLIPSSITYSTADVKVLVF